jgi:hypothetical protein
MSVQETNVEKLDDLEEAKKASFGVDAEVPDPTGVTAQPPGGAAQAGDQTPPTQGSGLKPYTKVGMINAMVGAMSKMKKQDVSAAYSKMMGETVEESEETETVAETKVVKIAHVTKEDLDVSEDIKAIFGGSEVSDEFIAKASEVFSAAVLSKINEQLDAVNGQVEATIAEETTTISESLVERVDSYLDYVVESWMADNAVAIERGLKAEIVEDFMKGLKNLFIENYIDLPEEAVDVVEEMTTKVESLEEAINEEIEKNVELINKIKEFERVAAFKEVSEGLTDTQVAKLESLSEAIDFEDVESYTKKVATLRESYFPTKASAAPLSESVTLDEEPVGEEIAEKQVPVEMAAYMSAITRGIKK